MNVFIIHKVLSLYIIIITLYPDKFQDAHSFARKTGPLPDHFTRARDAPTRDHFHARDMIAFLALMLH
jgi:hypothetical protein